MGHSVQQLSVFDKLTWLAGPSVEPLNNSCMAGYSLSQPCNASSCVLGVCVWVHKVSLWAWLSRDGGLAVRMIGGAGMPLAVGDGRVVRLVGVATTLACLCAGRFWRGEIVCLGSLGCVGVGECGGVLDEASCRCCS